ncbi:E3 SUMO-protein ligase PIAS2 [Holothuria leucospilota]|uniref:E3 SUMO-protein ligase PIAS2 n=1 Tax=Holothuria leucospilota TaxID=206669 RepID=A0A9Q1H291_HOLLE|nr:E3 SUMO-protein ligase PIAS2 [Holothuria leucospilota]
MCFSFEVPFLETAMLALIPCYPQNKPGVEAKRPGRPLNITPLIRLLPSATNQIEIQWIPEIARSYCATVHLVRQVTSEELLARLKARNVRNPDHSRALSECPIK